MAKKIDEQFVLVKKALDANKVIIGFKEVVQALRDRVVDSVYLANNMESERKADLEQLAKVQQISVIELPFANDDLGVACKKPYSISVLAIKHE